MAFHGLQFHESPRAVPVYTGVLESHTNVRQLCHRLYSGLSCYDLAQSLWSYSTWWIWRALTGKSRSARLHSPKARVSTVQPVDSRAVGSHFKNETFIYVTVARKRNSSFQRTHIISGSSCSCHDRFCGIKCQLMQSANRRRAMKGCQCNAWRPACLRIRRKRNLVRTWSIWQQYHLNGVKDIPLPCIIHYHEKRISVGRKIFHRLEYFSDLWVILNRDLNKTQI